uniref:Claudin n=1 Tax=Monopterus albus TaxID=43700 RepID=A0A3Q3IL31_MONAL
AKRQLFIAGLCLAIFGFCGTILICGLPMWKVTAFIGSNVVVTQVFWEGIWMNCVIQSTGHSQCKAYDSVLALPQELQVSRGLICVSIAVSVVAIGLTVKTDCGYSPGHRWLSGAHHYLWPTYVESHSLH